MGVFSPGIHCCICHTRRLLVDDAANLSNVIVASDVQIISRISSMIIRVAV
jgi:hypothetical protein